MNKLLDGFLHSCKLFPKNNALELNSETYSYSGLLTFSKKLALSLSNEAFLKSPFVTLLAQRSLTAYSGVLASLLSGKAYLPISPIFPVDRCLTMMRHAHSNVMIVGNECVDHLRKILSQSTQPCMILFPELKMDESWKRDFKIHRFLFSEDMDELPVSEVQIDLDPDSIAYLLFTSGSTGIPKGVPVSNRNAASYVSYILKHFELKPSDRCSQFFSLTFDPSIHDLFVTWSAGACLCVLPETELMAPSKYIQDKNLTVWYSVPSTGKWMSQLRLLKPNSFGRLRFSFFSAEALTEKMTSEWQAAAPNSSIINLYGPTEASVNISAYVWEKEESIHRCINGNVPIGRIFPTQKFCLLDDSGFVTHELTGELCLSGSQVTMGYLNDENKTKENFIQLQGQGEYLWYRTGDRVQRDRDDVLHFLGRVDDQIKLSGFRIELEEINQVLRKSSGKELLVTLPIAAMDGSVKSIISVVCTAGDALDKNKLYEACRNALPEYMIPSEIYFIDSFPLTSNGKTDKKKLLQLFLNQ